MKKSVVKNKEFYMRAALSLAIKAYKKGEVPIGAVVVLNDKIIGKGYNNRNASGIATRHAEIIAIEKACKKIKDWRLENAEIYVTLEPCPMCAGAIVNARIKKVYFGAAEPKSGGAGSAFDILGASGLNHKTECEGGVSGDECSTLIKSFFKSKRAGK